MLTSEFNPDADEIDVGDVDQRDNVVKRRLLTNEELVAQCLLFLLAGYETTSTTLAYIMYEMSVNPEAQKRLQEEIDELFPENVSYCLSVFIITFLTRPFDEVIIIKAYKYTCIWLIFFHTVLGGQSKLRSNSENGVPRYGLVWNFTEIPISKHVSILQYFLNIHKKWNIQTNKINSLKKIII